MESIRRKVFANILMVVKGFYETSIYLTVRKVGESMNDWQEIWELHLNELRYDIVFEHNFSKNAYIFFKNSKLKEINASYDWISLVILKENHLYNFFNLELGYSIGVEYKNKTKNLSAFFDVHTEIEINLIENFLRNFFYKSMNKF